MMLAKKAKEVYEILDNTLFKEQKK